MSIEIRNTEPVSYAIQQLPSGNIALLSVDWTFEAGDSIGLAHPSLLKVSKADGSNYFLLAQEDYSRRREIKYF
jgi:hypothetical protein